MDRRSWLWRRKSSEKSSGEIESSGSASFISERYSDDQEALRASPVSSSPNNAQSPEVTSKIVTHEVLESAKSLNEKLSAALFSLSAKDDLVKQHAKVAEEAVAGWEKAEIQVADLKQQLEATAKKNSALEERIGHLDGALKESVRQFRQSREDQEQKLQDTLIKKANQWEFQKFELETRVTELQAQLEARKAEATISVDYELQLKLQALENENSTLKAELLAAFEDLQMKTLEKELSTRAAETACKQHLESIKKVAKLEAERRRLRAAAKRSSPFKDNKHLTSACVESLTDSHSDSGEQLVGVDNELSCSDSWASALITELDQFKTDKVLTRNITTSVEIDLMDDFLEMESLAALPEANHVASIFAVDADADLSATKENPSSTEFESMRCKMAGLEEKVEKMASEKQELEMVVAETRNQLMVSYDQLIVAEDKLVELQRQLNSANGSKQAFVIEVESLESRKKEVESQLKAANVESKKLREKVCLLEGKSAEFATKCLNVEALTLKREQLEAQLILSHLEVEKLQEKAGLLEGKAEAERILCAELANKRQYVEAIEADKMNLESKLISAQLEGDQLNEKVFLLEGELKEQRALSAEFTAKVKALEEQKLVLSSQLEADKMNLESKLISAQLEGDQLHEKVFLLEGELKEQRALSAEFTAKVEALEEQKLVLSSLLEAAHVEAGKLREKKGTLEREVEEEREVSAELISKVDALEFKRETLSSLLESARFEAGKLRENTKKLENEVEVVKALSSDLEAKCKHLETLEAKREAIESQLSSAYLEAGELCQKVSLLEGKVEEQRALQSQLESAHVEVRKLHERVSFLEKEIEEERKLSAEFAAKCQSLKIELVGMKREVELQQPVSSTGELNIIQERGISEAARKLADCQNTIASLSRTLKLLTDFELMLEAEEPELVDKEILGNSSPPNGQERGLLQSSTPSHLPDFGKCLSPSRSYMHIQSQ